ncbi:MAG: DUF998 domain-containing protein [Endomicrobiales bacterium]
MFRKMLKNYHDTTQLFLTAGIIEGPFYIAVAIIQGFNRQGFNFTRHSISMLSLGDLGWIQIINFVVCGFLLITFALGVWRQLHSRRGCTWCSLLLGTGGVGMIAAGVFPTDPGFGFPPGGPLGAIPMSPNGILHSLAFFVITFSLVMACFIFTYWFSSLKNMRCAAYCMTTGVTAPILVFLAIDVTPASNAGVPMFGFEFIGSAWVMIIAWRLLHEKQIGMKTYNPITFRDSSKRVGNRQPQHFR